MNNTSDRTGETPESEAARNDAAYLQTVQGIIRAALNASTDLTSRDKLKISTSVISIDHRTERGQLLLATVGLMTSQQATLPLWLLRFFQDTLTAAPDLNLLPESSEEERRKALNWIAENKTGNLSPSSEAALALNNAGNVTRTVLPADVIQLATSLLTAALTEGVKGVAADE